MNIKKIRHIYRIILFLFFFIFSSLLQVQAAIWFQTTDVDFNAGTLIDVEVVGTGAAADLKPINKTHIVINKVSTGAEWVDLYNYGPPVNMNGWRFHCLMKSGNSSRGLSHGFPGGFVLNTWAFVRIHQYSGVNDADDIYRGFFNVEWTTTSAGAVVLENPAGDCVDMVLWNGYTVDNLISRGRPVHSWSGNLNLGGSSYLGRVSDNDTDTSSDWAAGVSSAKALNPPQTGIFPCSGTFLSDVFDSWIPDADWQTISWTESLLANTDITFALRTGNTPVPDPSWSGWSSEVTISGSTITSPPGRYIQYRATLTSSDGLNTPALHDLTIAYATSSCTVTPIRNADLPGKSVLVNSDNISVLSFKITDNFSHSIKIIRIFNIGDMKDGTDVSAVKLWEDVNHNFQWDPGDIRINGSGVWNPATSTWDFTGLNVALNTDLIVTIDIAVTGTAGRTFQAGMAYAGVICMNNGVSISAINNTGIITLLPFYHIFPDIFGVFPTKFNPNEDHVARIFFKRAGPEVEVKIYDVFGNPIRFWSMSNIKEERVVEWDGKDDNGNDVNAGIYIVYIKGVDVDKKIRMMLVK